MTQPINRNQLYTYGEVCELLNVSAHWIRTQRRAGLPIVQVGNRVWIDGGDLVAYMKGKQS